MKQNETQKSLKVAKNLHCEKCNYITCKLCDFKKHLTTDKHKKHENETFETEMKQNVAKSLQCICGVNFNSRSTLWRHKKKCHFLTNNDVSVKEETMQLEKQPSDKELIMVLIKENSELKNLMMEVIKNGTHNTTNNTNSNNKTFNLQFFLHETCKDAMNIMDFVDSIKLQLSDLEKVGSIGYVEGISNIITTNLKALDITQRPIHCTDNKREVLYVKDEDKWEKENDEKKKLRKAIKHIAHKNSKLITDFKNKYPDCVKSDSKKSDQYNKLIIEAMGGPGDNDVEKEDKIIKKITKEVTIDKKYTE
jgi:hypothetical protein